MSEDSPVRPKTGIQPPILPACVCAVLSVIFLRTGLLSFFFLVPLGYSAAAYGPSLSWLVCALAVFINAVAALGLGLYYRGGQAAIVLNILYFTVLSLSFTWVMAGTRVKPVRTAWRFIIAAAAGALCFLAALLVSRNDPEIAGLIRSQAEAVSSLYLSAAGTDAVRQSLLQRVLNPETIIQAVTSVALRGGLLASAFFLFFVSRQAAIVTAGIFRRQPRRPGAELAVFYAPPKTIWVLSMALAGILLGNVLKAAALEIAAWNVLVICAILFLAQGGGIVFYTLTHRALPPFSRFLSNVLLIIVIFSPGINVLALVALVFLGIAENWLPLRAANNSAKPGG